MLTKVVTLKRFMPRAKGSASAIHKRTATLQSWLPSVIKEVAHGTES